MSMPDYPATYAEYVYAELQKVRASEPGREDAVGQLVAAIRLDLGPANPSKVYILEIGDAERLRDDLTRVLADHEGTTS